MGWGSRTNYMAKYRIELNAPDVRLPIALPIAPDRKTTNEKDRESTEYFA